MRILDLDVARLLGKRQEASRILAEWSSEARERRNPSRLLHGIAMQARIEMDRGEYEQALSTIRELEKASDDYGLKSFLPRVLSYRVRVASHTGDRVLAQRALDELANLESRSVPSKLFQEASGQYASVFQADTSPSGLPTWVLMCLSLGLAGTLQYVVVTSSRRDEKAVLHAVTSPIMRLVRGGYATVRPVLQNRTAQPGDHVSVDPALVDRESPDAPNSSDDVPAETSPQSGDGFTLASEDAAWLKNVGISVQGVPEIDVSPDVEPTTLGDLLQKALDDATSVECFAANGSKVFDMPVPAYIIEHASSDRFMGIEMEDRLLIVYRYARPQHTMVKQDETGALCTVALNTPVTAVPIASIQREA